MNIFSELIGFLIILFALFFPLLHKFLKKKASENTQEEQREIPPIPKQKPKATSKPKTFQTPSTPRKKFDFHSNMESYTQKTHFEGYQLSTHAAPTFKDIKLNKDFIEEEHSKVVQQKPLKNILNESSSLKKLVIYHAIFGKPKAFFSDGHQE